MYVLVSQEGLRVGRDSSVIIGNRCRMDGEGIEYRFGGRGFQRQSIPALGPTCTMRLKRPRRGVDHPNPSSAEVKEGVQLYFYAPSGPLWRVLG
jgi:hypothetical protein